ncbi:NAD(P)-binding protein [Cadophora sp. DSE1049]|nr:NAD(P)-binding protein [Cadophora sp. DSE1049]
MATTFDITPEERASVHAFIKRQVSREPPITLRKDVDLAGKTAIVTGGNTGLGFECCKQLLDLGLSRVIIAVRSEAKGEAGQKLLLEGRSFQDVEVWPLDLALYRSVQSFAERAATLNQLHIVIHNSGVSKATFDINPSTGHEEDIQINYLSAALFAILLLPILESNNTPERPGRFVLVNSETSAWASFKERNSTSLLVAFDKPENFVNMDRYWTSKLLGQFFMTELAKRVPPTVAVINCDITGLAHSSPDAAVNHGLVESHGHYIEDGKLQPMAPIIYKAEAENITKQLWRETMNELAFANVEEILQSLSSKR